MVVRFIKLYLYVLQVMDSGPGGGRSERCSSGEAKLQLLKGWHHQVKAEIVFDGRADKDSDREAELRDRRE